MKFEFYNPHPLKNRIGDCAIRALTKALNKSWEQIYIDLVIDGFVRYDLPNADIVWGRYLIKNGFHRVLIPDDGLGDYTVEDFANDHPKGTYVLSMPGKHVVTIVDGILYDTWNSSEEVPSFYFTKN
jgi:hypothetical protein